MGNQAAAGAAAANGGNLDSFAEYNKNATNLGYKLAGENAIENMRRGYADSSTKFFDTWGSKLNENAKNLGDYEYTNKALESNEKLAKITAESNERIAEITAKGDLDVAKLNASIQQYLGELDFQIRSGQINMEGYIAGLNYAAQIAGFDKDKFIAELESDAAKAGMELEKYIAEGTWETDKYIAYLPYKYSTGRLG